MTERIDRDARDARDAKDKEFIHFETFIQNSIPVMYKCSSNTEYFFNIKRYSNEKQLCNITNYFFIKPQNYALNNFGECKICYEEKVLITRCNVCNHPFCTSCLDRITNSKCANCRSPN